MIIFFFGICVLPKIKDWFIVYYMLYGEDMAMGNIFQPLLERGRTRMRNFFSEPLGPSRKPCHNMP